jgi:hypothetical protein
MMGFLVFLLEDKSATVFFSRSFRVPCRAIQN